jgi:hypothetical protein
MPRSVAPSREPVRETLDRRRVTVTPSLCTDSMRFAAAGVTPVAGTKNLHRTDGPCVATATSASCYPVAGTPGSIPDPQRAGDSPPPRAAASAMDVSLLHPLDTSGIEPVASVGCGIRSRGRPTTAITKMPHRRQRPATSAGRGRGAP